MPPLSIKRPANRKNFQKAKLFSPGRLTLSLRRHAAALIRRRGAPPPAFTANAQGHQNPVAPNPNSPGACHVRHTTTTEPITLQAFVPAELPDRR